MNLRDNLYEFRVTRKLSQDILAKMLGVTRKTYWSIEKGFSDGSLKFWRKLQEVFGLPSEELVELMKNAED